MRKIAFIVGAGASTDFGLPLGANLINIIRDMVSVEVGNIEERPLIDSAMRTSLIGNYGDAAKDIAGGMNVARSIDRFLETRKDQPLVTAIGKRAIAMAIGQAEHRSPLGQSDLDDWHEAQQAMIASKHTWLARLFALLQEGVYPDHSDDVFAGISFVTFNYDRIIEHYLSLAFRHSMKRSQNEAHALVAAIQIEHIYGSLGTLPVDGNSGTPFGPEDRHLRFLIDDLGDRIRTFTESQDSEVLARARTIISNADIIIFLGFAFDPLNVDALFERPLRDNQICAGTILGTGPNERDTISRVILGSNDIEQGRFHYLNCADYISENEFRALVAR